jgi:membrane fusion protein (multidrug efflux system)
MQPEQTPKTSAAGWIKRQAMAFLPFLILLLVVLAVIFFLNSRIDAKKAAVKAEQSQDSQPHHAPTNVITMKIEPALIKETLNLPGIAKPWVQLHVVSEVVGKIIKKKVEDGQSVKKGDVLAVIDISDYQNAYDGALASYESALATQKRLKALVKKNFVTQSQLDDAVARVKTTKAAVNNARLNLSRCTIVSPMNGIVDQIHIENGSYLNIGDPVANILQMDTIKIEVGIPESDVDAVRQLSEFDIIIDALGQKKYTGYAHYLHKTADSFARLYTLEIGVDNPNGDILPDMFARVEIVKNQDPDGLAVPMYALVSQNETIGVFVEKNSQVRFRPVQPGFLDGWKTQIVNGLSPNEHVVVVGHRIVENGEQVNVTRVVKDMAELSK